MHPEDLKATTTTLPWAKLVSVDEKELEEAWAAVFLNPQVVQQLLKEVPSQDLSAIITAGLTWRGSQWTTSKAALRIRHLTDLALVAPQLQDYLNPFLASLALAGGVEGPLCDLDEHGTEISFRLAELWQGGNSSKGLAPRSEEGRGDRGGRRRRGEQQVLLGEGACAVAQ